MKTYLLELTPDGVIKFHDWDSWIGFVVKAENENEAREIITQKSNEYDTGREHYSDPKYVSCIDIETLPKGIIISSFFNG